MDALPEWFIQNLSAEELVEARREKLQHLELWQKLNAGQLYQVARKDVDELFAIFDVEGSGEISIEELMEINKVEGLVLTSSDVEALGRDADKDGSGLISAKELYKAMIQGEVAYNLVKKSINQESFAQQLAPGVTRPVLSTRDECLIDDLIEWMRHPRPVSKDLWSLPQTICLFAVFQWCATSHIPVRTNWRMAKNFDAAWHGSYKFSFIYDYTSLWDFFEHTFLEQHANQEPWLDDNTTSISVDTIYMNPALGTWTFEQLTWFFENNGYLHHVQTTETFLIEPYKDWSAVIPDVLFILILMRILYFEMKEFVPAMATGLDGIMNYLQLWNIVDWLTISWGIVCALLWLIALLQLDGLQPAIEELPLPVFDAIEPWRSETGAPKQRTSIETVNIINKTYLAPQQAMREREKKRERSVRSISLVPSSVRLRDREVGWRSSRRASRSVPRARAPVGLAQLNAVMTHEDYYGRLARVFDAFQDRRASEMSLGPTGRSPSDEDPVDRSEEAVSIWNESVRLVWIPRVDDGSSSTLLQSGKTDGEDGKTACESFKANKRLNVVINTLTHSVKDVSHFAIVFATIFLCYAWAAHVFFGWSIEAASSMFGAAYWRWSGSSPPLDEDVPGFPAEVLGYAYTLSYEFLVLNLLFGILFGLVFEAYGRTRAEAGKTDTLLAQIRKSITEMRRKKDFVNDYYMICALEDEDAPAHPGEIVTIRSLLEAFRNNKMTKDSAPPNRTDPPRHRTHDTQVEVGLMDALKLVGRMRTISLKSTLRTESLLKQLKDESQRPQEMRYRCIMAGFDPDNTEEMQEFIRASTLQALEEDHPLPNAVAAAGPQQSKLSINSRTFSREHSSKEGTKDVIDDTAEERTVKDRTLGGR
ncbi:Polycystin-2 (Curly up) (Cup) (Polycystic kidney disease 2 protein homolog) (Transient receptor potential cation channel subfamily P member 2) [Durusdinium trenchii]|uniref:Polycystin-2 (Curly up) (Cup) (Polycystic kidney disease 2 protein homolog) (Transient receptor potential cation channel subfamily P member 2) n=1 Tax=Durusdinium trenchii TaxID=1381693 RepID=A0ABP0SNW6_9DINO